MKNKDPKIIGFGENISYAFSGFGINFFFGMPMMFLVIYFTDVFGISAAAVGTLLLVSRIWDAINDPLMGMMVDHTKSKWGKCRPYMIFGPFILLGSFIMLFSGPSSMGEIGKLVWAYVSYILFGMAYTIVDVPSNAVISNMTQNGKERLSVTTLRRFVSNFGLLIGAGLVIPMVGVLGKGDAGKGYSLMATIFGTLSALMIISSGLTARERVVPTKNQHYGFKDIINMFKTNTPMVIIAALYFVSQIAISIKSASIAYYFTYNIGKISLISIVSVLSLLGTLLGTALIPLFTKLLKSKVKLVIVGLIVMALSSAGLFFSPNENIALIIILFFINALSSAYGLVMPFILMIDAVEYGELKTGFRSEGLVFSVLTFSMKLGTAVGGAILGYILSGLGYVPNVEQSVQALFGIKFCVAGLPIAAAIVGIILLKFYTLDEKKYAEIVDELKIKKSNKEII